MKDLDPKSLIIGFLTASVVALVVALIQTKDNEIGRYYLGKAANGAPMAIDTKTGTMYFPKDADDNSYEGHKLIPIKIPKN
jgi:hypothetical protein